MISNRQRQTVVLLAACVWCSLMGRSDAQSAAPAAAPDLRTNLYSHVLSKADLEAAFKKVDEAKPLYTKPNHAVVLRVASAKRPWQTHADADEFWFIQRGTAKLALAEFTAAAGVTPPGKQFDLSAGDVAYVPRNLAYQIVPNARLEYVAVRIFSTGARGAAPAAAGAPVRAPRLAPNVTPKAQFDQTFSTMADSRVKSQPFHSAGAVSIGQNLYDGAPGPWESHERSDQIYFVRSGTARGYLDGYIVQQEEVSPGQVRGTSVIGASEYAVGEGDIILVPRNTAHYIDPGTARYGYILITIN